MPRLFCVSAIGLSQTVLARDPVGFLLHFLVGAVVVDAAFAEAGEEAAVCGISVVSHDLVLSNVHRWRQGNP
jgi:hypothetical protein